MTDATARQSFFEDIAARLAPGGLLFDADLCADPADPSFDGVMDLWLDCLEHSAICPDEGRPFYRAAFGRDFAVHGPAAVEAMIARAGFTAPTQCLQIGLISGWIAIRR